MQKKLSNKQRDAHIDYLRSIRLSGEALKEYVDAYLADYQLTGSLLKEIFLCYSMPNEEGYTREILMADLIRLHPSFQTTNGGDWCRSDVSPLGKEFIIARKKQNGSIYSIRLDGKNKKQTEKYRGIADWIVSSLKTKKCVILDVGTNIEIDHKNGKYNDKELEDTQTQRLSDFQAMSKAANNAKRAHCRQCKETGRRFDARRLGYKESFTMGDFDSVNCEGCYWHDPQKFNRLISVDFNKEF